MWKASLLGKSALITGGAGGFGKACALELLRAGATVTLMGRTEPALEAARASLLAGISGAKVALHVGDATSEPAVKDAIARTVEHGGGIDVVVATVGGGAMISLLEETYMNFMQNLELNIGPAFLVVRHAAPKMSKGGAFVFISSTAAEMSFPRLASYCTGKAALDHFVRTAANELGSRGIRLNAVRPGLTHTDGADRAFQNQAYVNSFLPMIPLGRTGVPMDIACAVRFLASPEASWITGQSLAIDGGNELRGAPLG